MNTQEHQPHPFELFLILTLPFIGTVIVVALSYWLNQFDILTRI